MNLLLRREYKKPDYTIGKLYIDGDYFCDTLEDKDRGLTSDTPFKEIIKKKIYGQTAIPTGTYKVDMNTVSPKFRNRSWAIKYKGKIPRLVDIIGFEGILIHPGNDPSSTLGCILVGKNTVKGKVTNSTNTFHSLMRRLLEDKDNITIEIR